jgi:NitT/TauT family transport system permease protein
LASTVTATEPRRGDVPTADDTATNFIKVAVRPGRKSVGTRAALVVRRSAAIVALLALWEVLPRVGLFDRVFLPPLSEDVTALAELAGNGVLFEHVQASLVRSLSGFGLAIALSIPLGLLIGWYKPVAEFLTPVLELFRNTSAVALLPVFILILGLGETSKIAFIVYACSWPILLNTISGVKTVEPLLIKSARSMGLGPLRLFQKVILPAGRRLLDPRPAVRRDGGRQGGTRLPHQRGAVQLPGQPHVRRNHHDLHHRSALQPAAGHG